MFIRYRTEAIFLKKLKRFEADEHLIVYTKDFGKIGVTGKSIRKIKSKLRSSSELFCHSSIEFVRGRYYNILTDSELISSFSETKKDLGKMSVAFKAAHLLDSFLAEEEKDEHLWFFIKKTFYLLDELSFKDNKKKKLQSFYYYFAFKLLELLGYKPEIGSCTVDEQEDASIFSPREGGFICEVCSRNIKDPLKIKLTKEDKTFLLEISKNSFEDFIEEEIDFSDNISEMLANYIAILPSKIS
ncbi:MAG: DNA repair protein RecO [Patescibacteria group bacterium]